MKEKTYEQGYEEGLRKGIKKSISIVDEIRRTSFSSAHKKLTDVIYDLEHYLEDI